MLTGISIEQSKKDIFKYDKSSIINKITKCNKKKEIYEPKKDHNYILDDCVKDPEGVQQSKYNESLIQFKKDRKIPDNIPIFVAYKGKYKGRFIIPVFDNNNNIIYFQARRIHKKQEPKYMNPSSEKKIIIHNEYKFDREKCIVVVEGLLDAISIGDQGTVCFGSNITDEFIKKLMKMTNVGVVIALDNDETGKKSLQKFIDNSKYSKKVKYFIYPYDMKDINSIDTDVDINIYNMIIDNAFELHAVKAMSLI